MKEDSPARIEAGVEYFLAKYIDDGHVFAERDALVDEAREALGVPPDQVNAAINRLVLQQILFAEDEAIYIMLFYRAEIGAAN